MLQAGFCVNGIHCAYLLNNWGEDGGEPPYPTFLKSYHYTVFTEYCAEGLLGKYLNPKHRFSHAPWLFQFRNIYKKQYMA